MWAWLEDIIGLLFTSAARLQSCLCTQSLSEHIVYGQYTHAPNIFNIPIVIPGIRDERPIHRRSFQLIHICLQRIIGS